MTRNEKKISALVFTATLGLLSGCGGASAPPVTLSPSSPTSTGATNASVYVIQSTGNSNDQILMFAAGTAGTATPSSTITTNLYLDSVAVDSSGQIYAGGVNVSTGAFIVNVYAAGASGVATPVRAITLAAEPYAITTDAAGSLYVADNAGEIVVYSSAATGTATPTSSISGALTSISTPQGIAVDSAGTIYLASYNQITGAAGILLFPAGSNGNVAPSSTLLPPAGSLFAGVALDSARNIYATTNSLGASSYSSVVEYGAGSSGSATPLATITGSSSLLSTGSTDVGALTLDASGNMYLPLESASITGNYSYSILEFPAGTNGNAVPYARVSSPSWTAAGSQIAAH